MTKTTTKNTPGQKLKATINKSAPAKITVDVKQVCPELVEIGKIPAINAGQPNTDNVLTKEEKKLIRHRIMTRPGEADALLGQLQFISYENIAWYKEEKDSTKTEAISVRLFAYYDAQFEGISAYLNHKAYYVHCNYDGRLWRVKSPKYLHKLLKALKKDVVNRFGKYLVFENLQ